jgi:hypothetical protein
MEACKVERVVLNALAKHKCGFAGQLSLCALLSRSILASPAKPLSSSSGEADPPQLASLFRGFPIRQSKFIERDLLLKLCD